MSERTTLPTLEDVAHGVLWTALLLLVLGFSVAAGLYLGAAWTS